jgi:hypothetical protein
VGGTRSLTKLRRLLAAFALLLATFFPGEARAQRISLEIALPVSRSEPQLAAYLRRALPGEVQKVLAGKYKGPLRIRINDAKIMRHPGFGIADRADYLDGMVLVPGRDPIPIRLTLPFDRSMFSFTPMGENVRVRNLVEVFAQWVAKYI